jgi:hypothetical protein
LEVTGSFKVFHSDSGCGTLTTVRHLHEQQASNSIITTKKAS